MRPQDYRGFIREAYVEPLRSVLIVDDDYPTLEEALAPVPEDTRQKLLDQGLGKRWWTQPQQIQKVISGFRRSRPSMIVDVHDGENLSLQADAQIAQHLHQSDLLVLDYSLDKTAPGNGDRAVQILRKVMQNEQFNLVVLHTSENLDVIFPDIVLALHAPAEPFFSEDEEAAVVDRIGPAEIDDPTIMLRVEASLTQAHYLAFRQNNCVWPIPASADAPPTTGFEELAAKAGFEDAESAGLLAKKALSKVEDRLKGKMLASPLPNLTWGFGKRTWIRTDTGFIAFTSKKPDREDLISELIHTLESSKPDPSRLFLAKLSAEIDKDGVAESRALGEPHVLAHWYKRLLESSDEAQKFQIGETITRHADLLMAGVMAPVTKFAERMVRADADRTPDAICNDYFGVDLSVTTQRERATLEHNAFVCSKAVEGHHLVTGHIFKADDHIWACMTPACDLVPGRENTARHGKIGNRLPFIAVRLEPVTMALKKMKVNSNRFIFLRLDGEVRPFCIAKENDEGANPVWFSLLAENQGRFGRLNTFKFSRAQMGRGGVLKMRMVSAKVVAQLRYEYALNFMQKLSGSMNRIGLDFAKYE